MITEDFFENYVKKDLYIAYISDVVIKEIEKTRSKDKRKQLLEIIPEYRLRILELNEDADNLAGIYIKEGIIPGKKIEDAQHIGIATTNNIDVLLSWNFKHLTNIKKQKAVKIINEKEGFYCPLILTNPMEVLYEEEE